MRSIRRIAWFHEFWISNSNLIKMQLWNLCVSRCQLPKQKLNDDVEVEWKSSCSSIMLQVEGSSICHGWARWWQPRILPALATIEFNRCTISPAIEDTSKNNANTDEIWWNSWKKCEKVWRKLERIWWFCFWIWENEMSLPISVMIMPLYHVLIQMLIKFRQIGSD